MYVSIWLTYITIPRTSYIYGEIPHRIYTAKEHHIVATLHRTNKSLEKVDVERAYIQKLSTTSCFHYPDRQDMF